MQVMMPMTFHFAFGCKVAVIMDCFDIFMKLQTWGGRAIDKKIIKTSGCLKKSLSSDLVLADCAFDFIVLI